MSKDQNLELNPDPASTHGASEEYKAAWAAEYGQEPEQQEADRPDVTGITPGPEVTEEEEADRPDVTGITPGPEAPGSQDTGPGRTTAEADQASGQATPGGQAPTDQTAPGGATDMGTSPKTQP